MVSEQGMSIRFPVSGVRPRLRNAGGVIGMKLRKKGHLSPSKKRLAKDDRVIAMSIIPKDSDSRLLVISEKGFGKLTPVSEYRQQGTGGFGLATFDIQPRKTGPVAVAEVVDDSKELYLVSEQAQVLRTNLSEIKTTIGRKTQGVRIFKLQAGDAVASIACVGDLDSNGASATGNGRSAAAKPSAESANALSDAPKNGAVKPDAGEQTSNHQLSLGDMEQDEDDTAQE